MDGRGATRPFASRQTGIIDNIFSSFQWKDRDRILDISKPQRSNRLHADGRSANGDGFIASVWCSISAVCLSSLAASRSLLL